MCVHDQELRETVVARFLEEFPQVLQVEVPHPALQGIRDIAWSRIPGCPAAVPELFNGLVDAEAGQDAARVLGIVLLDGTFHLSAAMPGALPFLIRLAADRRVAAHAEVLELLVHTAEMARPMGDDVDPRWTLFFGSDGEHPERAACRQVFAAQRAALQALLADAPSLTADERAALSEAGTAPTDC
ncbi:hypothetical protein ACQEU3_41945 [Spirillospora sp. CA-253888]